MNAGVDERGRGVVAPTPVGDGEGRELGTVIATQERRCAVSGHECIEDVHDLQEMFQLISSRGSGQVDRFGFIEDVD